MKKLLTILTVLVVCVTAYAGNTTVDLNDITIYLGVDYRHAFDVNDPNGDIWTIEDYNGPDGTAVEVIDTNSWKVTWTPTAVGDYNFVYYFDETIWRIPNMPNNQVTYKQKVTVEVPPNPPAVFDIGVWKSY